VKGLDWVEGWEVIGCAGMCGREGIEWHGT
jgi:hypothetical protein